jgi:hypothetical protein
VTRRRAARRTPRALAAAIAAGIAGAGPAHAAASVVLDASACLEVPEPAIRRIVAIEIGDLLADGAAAAPANADRLIVRCQAGEARLEARGPGHPAPIERPLRLAEFPGDAAPRAVALAGIEMLAALSPAVRERIQIRQSAPAAAAPAPATASGGSLHVGVSAVRRDFFSAGGLGAWGGRLDVDRGFGDWWTLSGDVEGAFGRATAGPGEVSAVLISLGGFWGVRGTRGRVAGSVSIGARGGLAMLEGTPSNDADARGARVTRPWWGPALRARGTLGLGLLALVASVEAGVAARGAEGLSEDTTVLAVSGAWLAGAAGLAF